MNYISVNQLLSSSSVKNDICLIFLSLISFLENIERIISNRWSINKTINSLCASKFIYNIFKDNNFIVSLYYYLILIDYLFFDSTNINLLIFYLFMCSLNLNRNISFFANFLMSMFISIYFYQKIFIWSSSNCLWFLSFIFSRN